MGVCKNLQDEDSTQHQAGRSTQLWAVNHRLRTDMFGSSGLHGDGSGNHGHGSGIHRNRASGRSSRLTSRVIRNVISEPGRDCATDLCNGFVQVRLRKYAWASSLARSASALETSFQGHTNQLAHLWWTGFGVHGKSVVDKRFGASRTDRRQNRPSGDGCAKGIEHSHI